jgi:hypothetical protein
MIEDDVSPVITLDRYMFEIDLASGLNRLYGYVYNHPTYRDGKFMRISRPTVWLNREAGIFRTKSDKVYLLEEPAGNREAIYSLI